MAASGAFSYFCCRVAGWVEAKQAVSARFYATRIMPIVLFMALTLFTGNQVYLYLSVSFIQMLKVRGAWCVVCWGAWGQRRGRRGRAAWATGRQPRQLAARRPCPSPHSPARPAATPHPTPHAPPRRPSRPSSP